MPNSWSERDSQGSTWWSAPELKLGYSFQCVVVLFWWKGQIGDYLVTFYCSVCRNKKVVNRLYCVRVRSVASVMSSSLWPRGLQPARLLCPWDYPGKNTGVGCHFLLRKEDLPSRGSSQLRDPTCSFCIAGGFFTTEPPEKPLKIIYSIKKRESGFVIREISIQNY